MKNSKRLLALAVAAACGAPLAAHATNGMNLEGYGPIATGMGGASMAYDNGTAAMMNNPATLGLADDGSRLDVALGVLGPNVESSAMGTTWKSKSDSFMMPALGWAKKDGKLTWGLGAFAQGGMGTEYKATSPGAAFVFAPSASMGGDLSGASAIAGDVMGWEEMSEVGVMRILLPVNYQVNEGLNVGGSIDFVRATMDMKMVMTGGMMADMMNPAQQNMGTLSGSMVDLIQGMAPPALYGAQFDFADKNPYSGKTEGSGFAAKIGFTYKVNSQLTVGGTYHSETSMSDLSGNATANMAVDMGGGDMVLPVNGKIKIKNFQWPATYALGLSFQATDKLMLAADVKVINWSAVMKDFKMSFTATGNTGPAAGFNDTTMDAVLFQNWKDQTVTQIGGAYKVTDATVVRAGLNIANNPIPNSTTHYLFPATIENHLTLGVGHSFSKADSVDFSLTHAPEVKVTNGLGMTIKHAQTNWQLMYSHRF